MFLVCGQDELCHSIDCTLVNIFLLKDTQQGEIYFCK